MWTGTFRRAGTKARRYYSYEQGSYAMRITAQRKDGGAPLRTVMRDQKIGLQALAQRTKLADPDGKGVSFQLLGFLTQDAGASRHARETCEPRTAGLIEDALGVPRKSLFDLVEAPSRSDKQPGWDDLKNVSGQ